MHLPNRQNVDYYVVCVCERERLTYRHLITHMVALSSYNNLKSVSLLTHKHLLGHD